ncbi:MAG TPA: hypothetical protein VIQ01_06340 [Burkholderiales bacterium]
MLDDDGKKLAEAFNYLSVVISIILGLGIGDLLSGCARLIYARESLAINWLYGAWVVLLLPVYLVYWWAFWDYRKQVRWTFIAFFFLLVGPIGLYLITVLLLPETSPQRPFDASAHYLQIRRWFFGLWALLQVWGILLAPWLKEGFTRAAFLNRYKYAQYILLAALLAGFFSTTPSSVPSRLDTAILAIFWIVLLYLLGTHRRQLQTS